MWKTSRRWLMASAGAAVLVLALPCSAANAAIRSITMYDGKSKLLVDNPMHRYLVNSRMLPSLRHDADGGVTLHIQHEAPAGDARQNWLPAPDGPFYVILGMYMPRPEAANGSWKQPPLVKLAR